MTVFIIVACLLLLAFGLLFLALARDNRVLSREPSEFELAARRFNRAMVDVQIAFADALTPALKRAADAMTEFHARLTESDQTPREKKP